MRAIALLVISFIHFFLTLLSLGTLKCSNNLIRIIFYETLHSGINISSTSPVWTSIRATPWP